MTKVFTGRRWQGVEVGIVARSDDVKVFKVCAIREWVPPAVPTAALPRCPASVSQPPRPPPVSCGSILLARGADPSSFFADAAALLQLQSLLLSTVLVGRHSLPSSTAVRYAGAAHMRTTSLDARQVQ